ncbi:hypothetical protein AGOR_G00080800 [Albula goreensis]|uniref:Uncharacterized protein n=1 Tax=Albula goreensis TaxID=1534307 RepID=A0A8T3DIS9_9TELE|nr:hypothetical protein AGOR_G00080800 [Albula goreensis]
MRRCFTAVGGFLLQQGEGLFWVLSCSMGGAGDRFWSCNKIARIAVEVSGSQRATRAYLRVSRAAATDRGLRHTGSGRDTQEVDLGHVLQQGVGARSLWLMMLALEL